MAMHACQIGPTDTAPPCPGLPLRACIGTKGGERFGASNLSTPISPLLLKCADGATTLSLHFGIDQDLRILGSWMVNWLLDVSEVDRPGSSSTSVAGLLTAKTGEGDGDVRHWVLGGCRSRAISILWCIVRATKAATWSHPSALFSIIGMKQSDVRGGSPIFSRAVIASSQYSRNAGHSIYAEYAPRHINFEEFLKMRVFFVKLWENFENFGENIKKL